MGAKLNAMPRHFLDLWPGEQGLLTDRRHMVGPRVPFATIVGNQKNRGGMAELLEDRKGISIHCFIAVIERNHTGPLPKRLSRSHQPRHLRQG